MSGRAGEEVRERVRDATDIVQLIGEHVTLRRAGRSYKGLCPFHAEKTPSFTVTPDRQMWHCFGCSKGGDVFAFVMEREKMAFPETLRALADRAGIELPRTGGGERSDAFDTIYQANALARDFYRASLVSEAGQKARAYVAARGFEEPWVTRFELGWAPEGWDGLSRALAQLLPAPVLEQAGLTVRRGDGSGSYDRFRNRLLFPVATGSGKIAGFTGRAIAPGDEPKYLNSPETPVFRKGRLLYGLVQARPGIREKGEAVVCEGNLDVVRLHACGFTNAVATCGTALTQDQARLLARLRVRVLLLYDGDDAGVRAADRGLDPLLEAGVETRVLLLPRGEDPDSFLRKEGAGALTARIDAAGLDVPGFLAESKLASGAAPALEARVHRLVGLLNRVEDPIRRRLMLRRGADVFGLEESVLLEAVQGKGRARTKKAEAAPAAPVAGAEVTAAASEQESAPSDPVERELAGRVLTEEGALAELTGRGGAIFFRSRSLRELLEPWLAQGRPPRDEELRDLSAASPVTRELLAELHPEPGRTHEASRREARDLIQRIEERRIRAEREALQRAIQQAERGGDKELLARLTAEWRDLASELHTRTQHAMSRTGQG
jgi:DNA primase